jgi:RNA polymerase sigma-70 factor (ECF subfamily)
LDAVRQEKGRLRSYLLTSLKNFVAKARRHELAIKRGECRALVPLDELLARERADLEPADTLSADRIYERRWALTLLEQVLARLADEYRAAGPASAGLFERLKQTLTDEPGKPSQAKIAEELSMNENAVKQAFYRLRQRYRLLLQEEIAHTVAVPGDVEDELRHFITVLQT